MRKFLVALLLAISLGGCAAGGALNVNKPVPVNTVQSPVQLAQAAIRQAYAVHASVSATVKQNYLDKVITKVTKDDYAAKLDAAFTSLNTADALAGTNPDAAQAELALANALIGQIQNELAKLAAKEKK